MINDELTDEAIVSEVARTSRRLIELQTGSIVTSKRIVRNHVTRENIEPIIENNEERIEELLEKIADKEKRVKNLRKENADLKNTTAKLIDFNLLLSGNTGHFTLNKLKTTVLELDDNV